MSHVELSKGRKLSPAVEEMGVTKTIVGYSWTLGEDPVNEPKKIYPGFIIFLVSHLPLIHQTQL